MGSATQDGFSVTLDLAELDSDARSEENSLWTRLLFPSTGRAATLANPRDAADIAGFVVFTHFARNFKRVLEERRSGECSKVVDGILEYASRYEDERESISVLEVMRDVRDMSQTLERLVRLFEAKEESLHAFQYCAYTFSDDKACRSYYAEQLSACASRWDDSIRRGGELFKRDLGLDPDLDQMLRDACRASAMLHEELRSDWVFRYPKPNRTNESDLTTDDSRVDPSSEENHEVEVESSNGEGISLNDIHDDADSSLNQLRSVEESKPSEVSSIFDPLIKQMVAKQQPVHVTDTRSEVSSNSEINVNPAPLDDEDTFKGTIHSWSCSTESFASLDQKLKKHAKNLLEFLQDELLTFARPKAVDTFMSMHAWFVLRKRSSSRVPQFSPLLINQNLASDLQEIGNVLLSVLTMQQLVSKRCWEALKTGTPDIVARSVLITISRVMDGLERYERFTFNSTIQKLHSVATVDEFLQTQLAYVDSLSSLLTHDDTKALGRLCAVIRDWLDNRTGPETIERCAVFFAKTVEAEPKWRRFFDQVL